MQGISATTGKRLQGIEHLRQSLRDILTTPIGTRVMRREYGSRLFQLVDAPLNRFTLLQLYAATAEAIRKWEPRIQLTKVRASSAEPGSISLDLEGVDLESGQELRVYNVRVR